MRVVLVSGYDANVPGGVQNQVALIAGELAAGGADVAVIAPASSEATLPAGVRLVAVGRSYAIPANGSVAPVAPTPTAAARTRRALAAFSPDVVHVHEPLLPAPPLVAVLMRSRPLVATFHRAEADPLYRLEARALGRLVTRPGVLWTAVSPAAAATARAVLGRRLGEIIDVPNGVSLARFTRARDEAARARSRPQETRPRVVFLGRLERRKGAAVLCAAARLMSVPAEVLVAGDGPERVELERAAPGNVVFLGRPDDEAAASLLAGADVFVAPSLSGESFGVVLLEAMAAGTAVVASDLAGYASAAAGAARLVPPGDGVALASVLDELLGDEAARLDLARRGRARAEECGGARVVARYRELYEWAVSRQRVGPRAAPS